MMGPIRLVHITTVPDSLLFLRGQVSYMKQRGYEISAISSPGEMLDAFGREEGVAVHPVEMPRRITPVADLRTVARIVSILQRVRPTIVHAHTPKGGLLGMIAAATARVPVRIYHMRGLAQLSAQGWKKELLTLTERVSCRLAGRVLCVSHSVREVAIEQQLCPASKIEVLLAGSGNGVDAAGRFNPDRGGGAEPRARVRGELRIPADALVFGFVGRLVRDKGLVELGDAWARLRTVLPTAHLLLVGKFEPQDPVPDRTRRSFESDDRVHLAGFREDTPGLYAAMDVVVLPTYREGFPNVPLEAASMRLPVVATRIPGCVDAVEDGVTGTLVPVRDAEGLGTAMERYALDAGLCSRHGASGRERVLRLFTRERIWEAIAEVYARELELRGLAPAQRSAA